MCGYPEVDTCVFRSSQTINKTFRFFPAATEGTSTEQNQSVTQRQGCRRIMGYLANERLQVLKSHDIGYLLLVQAVNAAGTLPQTFGKCQIKFGYLHLRLGVYTYKMVQ